MNSKLSDPKLAAVSSYLMYEVDKLIEKIGCKSKTVIQIEDVCYRSIPMKQVHVIGVRFHFATNDPKEFEQAAVQCSYQVPLKFTGWVLETEISDMVALANNATDKDQIIGMALKDLSHQMVEAVLKYHGTDYKSEHQRFYAELNVKMRQFPGMKIGRAHV